MKRITKNKMLKRLAKLRDGMSTEEAARTLNLSVETFRQWLKDGTVVETGVVEDVRKKGSNRATYIWRKSKLIAWVQAVMNLQETKGYRPVKQNPSIEMNPHDAAESLGIPKGYRVKR